MALNHQTAKLRYPSRPWRQGLFSCPGSSRSPTGSVSALIAAYYADTQFQTLALISQQNYRRIFERFREDYGDILVSGFRPHHFNQILGGMGLRTGAALVLRKRLFTLMAFAVDNGWIETNPVAGSKPVKHQRKGFRTWSEEDVEAFQVRWPLGSRERTAMELLLWTGVRRKDVVRLGWKHVQSDMIVLTTSKSGHRTTLRIPIAPGLRAILDTLPRHAETFIRTAYGEARSEKGLTNWIGDAAKAAGITASASPHGLRKAICRRLADLGLSLQNIQAITGHKHLAELIPYIEARNSERLARESISALVKHETANPSEKFAESGDNPRYAKEIFANLALPRGARSRAKSRA